MKIQVLHLVEGAREARGTTVIIDVFRAFSLACYLFDKGAARIIPVGDAERAYRLKENNPGFMLVGERNNRKLPGFDYGNSPFEVRHANLKDKTVIHTTSAGTQGIVNAVRADEILTGSFVNAGAIIRHLLKRQPSQVSLVCMGYSAKYPIEEDTYCAEYIRQMVEGGKPDFEQMSGIIRNTSAKRFFIPEHQEHCPREDVDLCLRLSAFPFIIRAVSHDTFGIVLEKQTAAT